jgi:plasmid maintenance system antidote protein VapI
VNNNDLAPDWTSPPGDIIVEMLETQKVSLADFAQLVGLNIDETIKLTLGLKNIDQELAEKLSEVLGSTAKFWLARELRYRNELLRLSGNDDGKSK